ncbi:MAG TPA: beta-ketoacyl-ACP synthase 3, partial [Acidimicrobiales bacterium]|nr:beta-ketoacyl-ACP synthase 3 [Acidimicrobiales bacterium]
MSGATITGWGTALPDRVVTNEDIMTLFETTDEWIVERSGIHTRRAATGPFVASPPPHHPEDGLGTTAALAVAAGRAAMSSAGVGGADIGLLILCTTTPDQLIPASSAAASAALGIGGGAMDLNAACAGFTYGLVTAAGIVAAGMERVLLVGAETLTRATNWEDRTNAFLFGDGAGAVVVEATAGESSLLGWDLGVDGSLVPLLYADHGCGMVMRGQEVFRKAVRVTVDSANASMGRAKVTADDIALFVPHQANIRIMDAAASRLGIPSERVASVIDKTGNTSSASIPLALIDAVESGRLEDGDLVLLAGFGAGMTWASAVWRWG